MAGGSAFHARGEGHQGDAAARAQLEVALLDTRERAVAHDDEDQFSPLKSGLESERSRTHAVEFGLAPFMTAGAPEQDAVTPFGAEDEAAFDQLGHNINTAGLVHHARR